MSASLGADARKNHPASRTLATGDRLPLAVEAVVAKLALQLRADWGLATADGRLAILGGLPAVEPPFSSSIVQFFAWAITDGCHCKEGLQGPGGASEVVVAAWMGLEAYLTRFNAEPSKAVLMGSGVDVGQLHVCVRDAAWRQRCYELAERMNTPLLYATFRGRVDALTELSWENHLHILEAQEKWTGLLAYTGWLRAEMIRLGKFGLVDRLAPWIEKCRERTASKVTSTSSTAEPPGSTGGEKAGTSPNQAWRHPVPEGAGWPDLTLVFVDGETVRARLGGKTETLTYVELGFKNLRSAKPTKPWQALLALASVGGVLTWGDSGAARGNKHNLRRAMNNLKSFFPQLAGNPLERYGAVGDSPTGGKIKGWRTRFEATEALTHAYP